MIGPIKTITVHLGKGSLSRVTVYVFPLVVSTRSLLTMYNVEMFGCTEGRKEVRVWPRKIAVRNQRSDSVSDLIYFIFCSRENRSSLWPFVRVVLEEI